MRLLEQRALRACVLKSRGSIGFVSLLREWKGMGGKLLPRLIPGCLEWLGEVLMVSSVDLFCVLRRLVSGVGVGGG